MFDFALDLRQIYYFGFRTKILAVLLVVVHWWDFCESICASFLIGDSLTPQGQLVREHLQIVYGGVRSQSGFRREKRSREVILLLVELVEITAVVFGWSILHTVISVLILTTHFF